MNSSKQIKLGAILSYLSIAVNIISGLLYTPWMVATIGKSQYGLYTLANSVITLFLVDFGLSSATGRYLSKYNAEGNREAAESFLGAIYKLYLLIDAVILVVLVTVYFRTDKIFVNLTTAELEQFRVVFAISAIFSVINFPFVTFNGILTAYEKFMPLKIADLLYRLCNVGFTVVVLLLGYGLYALVLVHAAVGLLVLAFKYLVIRKTIPLKINFKGPTKTIYREIFVFSLWVTVSALAGRLVFTITPSILGMVVGSAAIAIFGIVSTIEGYVYTITTAINGLFMPKISRIVAGNQAEEDLNSLFLTVGKFQYILNGLIVALFAAVGRSFIRLWMGEDFIPAYAGILLVLVPGLFYNALEIANTTMVVTNKVKWNAFVCVITGVVNVCLSFPLSKIYGATGACISICIAYFIRDILFHIIYHRKLSLNIPQFMRKCYFRMSLPIVVTILCGYAVNHGIPDSGWGTFLLKAVLTTGIYGAAIFAFVFTQEERQAMAGWLRNA